MNEKEQNMALDELIDKSPLFSNYLKKWHNVEIKPNPSYTLCEIDGLYEYPTFLILFEDKANARHGCYKKMESQMIKYKRYENSIQKHLGIDRKPVYYFFAHFENDEIHIEYEGIKLLYSKK